MNRDNRLRTLTSLGLCFAIVACMMFRNLTHPWHLLVASPLAVGGLAIGAYGLWSWGRRRKT